MIKYVTTKPRIPGDPKRLTRIIVIKFIGIKIFVDDKIKFIPYNITNAIHIFLKTFIIFFAIFITLNYMIKRALYSDIFFLSSKAFSKVTLSK